MRKFNRYKFNTAMYARTFDFLDKNEQIDLAMGLNAVWKQHKPQEIDNRYDTLHVTAESINSETYNSKMYAKGKRKKWYTEQNR